MLQQSVVPTLIGWRRGDPIEWLVTREWLVTNGLGGYAAGTLGGACTRRFHGKLIAAMPAPRGRIMMFNHLEESISGPDGVVLKLSADELSDGAAANPNDTSFLEEFVLEEGLPRWRYSADGLLIEKRVVMPYEQNTTQIVYRVLEAPPGYVLHLRPSLHFRPHEGPLRFRRLALRLEELLQDAQGVVEQCVDLDGLAASRRHHPVPDLGVHPGQLVVLGTLREKTIRGVDANVRRWSAFRSCMDAAVCMEADLGGCASESLPTGDKPEGGLANQRCRSYRLARRRALLDRAGVRDQPVMAQLVMAADQFLIRPHTRAADEVRAHASGGEARTVIAGYHWFTDWGRDTMISLEGLTLVTGRHREAGSILRTFASYIRDGLIPNMFPEGDHEGLYHTADATPLVLSCTPSLPALHERSPDGESARSEAGRHHRSPSAPRAAATKIHIGTFTREGTFAAAAAEWPWLAKLGVTIIEIMPIAEFAGSFGWGYDGVDLWAPTHLYGTPDDFRALIDAAHAHGIAVILDVVYNHLGPDGNYLTQFSSSYFTDRYANEGQRYTWQKQRRGTDSRRIPAESLVWFLENHDQVANSVHGRRLHASTSPGRMRAMTALLLMGPATPMLFQGQEFGSTAPFLYFADHEPELAEAVVSGRREFLRQFPSFGSEEAQRILAPPARLPNLRAVQARSSRARGKRAHRRAAS